MTTTAGCAILSDPLHESVVAGVRLWCGRATLCLKIGGAATAGAPRKRAEMLAGAVDLALSCPAPTRRGRARTRGGRACWFAQEQEQQTLSLGGWYQSDSSSICLSLAHCTEPGSVLFQAELWFRGLMSRRRSVACYRPRRKRSRQGSADANGAQRAGDVHATTRCWGARCVFIFVVCAITNHERQQHPPRSGAQGWGWGGVHRAPPRTAKPSTNLPWRALSLPPGSACGGHYIDHPHQRPED